MKSSISPGTLVSERWRSNVTLAICISCDTQQRATIFVSDQTLETWAWAFLEKDSRIIVLV